MSETIKPSKKNEKEKEPPKVPAPAPEFGGQEGPDPTRYGDWEKNGRVSDF